VGGLDFAAVVDDVSGRGDQDLGQVEGCMVDFGESQRDVAKAVGEILSELNGWFPAYIWLSLAARRILLISSESTGSEFSRYFFSSGRDCW